MTDFNFTVNTPEPPQQPGGGLLAKMGRMSAAFHKTLAGAVVDLRKLFPESEICLVKTNNNDGTFDLLNASGYLMSRVPALDPYARHHILEGYSVQVRYYDVSRQKPYIKGYGPTMKPSDTISTIWNNTRANIRLNHLAPTKGDLFDITAGVIFGPATAFTDVIGFSPFFIPAIISCPCGSSGKTCVMLQRYSDAIRGNAYNTSELVMEIEGLPNPGNLIFVTTANSLWYVDALGYTLFAETSTNVIGGLNDGNHPFDSTRILIHNPTKADGIVSFPPIGSLIANLILAKVDACQGMTIAQDKLICSYHQHFYQMPEIHSTIVLSISHGLPISGATFYAAANITDLAPVPQRLIHCFQLPNLAPIWSWDPNLVWGSGGSSAIPLFARILQPTTLWPNNHFAGGNPPIGWILNSSFGSWNPIDEGSNIYTGGRGGSAHSSCVIANTDYLLPGHPALYLDSVSAVVVPISGRIGLGLDTHAEASGVLAGWGRLRSNRPGQPSPPSGGGPLGNFPSGKFLRGGTRVGLPRQADNASTLKGWIVALKTDQTSSPGVPPDPSSTTIITVGAAPTPTELWRQSLPDLNALDNYIIDQDSFNKVAAASALDQDWCTVTYAGHIQPMLGPTSANTASVSTDVVTPGMMDLTAYNPGDPLASPAISPSFTFAATESFTNYIHWPLDAAYRWGPNTVLNFAEASTYYPNNPFTAGSNGNGTGTGQGAAGHIDLPLNLPSNVMGTALVADVDDNIYGEFLQPFLIVSCASPEAILDRLRGVAYNAGLTFTTPGPWAGMSFFDPRFQDYDSSLDLIPDKVDYWISANSSPYVSDTSQSTLAITFYGDPWIYTKYKSFIESRSPKDGSRRWIREFTTYHDELIDNSGGLAGKLPYPGVTLRITPTSAGVFVLRAERLPIKTGLRDASLYPACGSSLKRLPFQQPETLYCQIVLYFVDPKTGSNIWAPIVIYNPTIDGPISVSPSLLATFSTKPYVMTRAAMLGSESDAGSPWVTGRIDFSTIYTLKDLVSGWDKGEAFNGWPWPPGDGWPGFAQPTPPGLEKRLNIVFSCDALGNVKVRAANRSRDMQGMGFQPFDYLNATSQTNGDPYQPTPMIIDGKIISPSYDGGGGDSYHVYRYGDNS